MKVENWKAPHSSFFAVDKDLHLIADKILKNKNLKKLLYYTTPDALLKAPLNDKQSIELFNKNIKVVPKIYVDGEVLNYIVITFDNFLENVTNPEFRDCTIIFDIVCHMDQWQLIDSQLRPYRIAAELDSMIDNQRLPGIGLMEFMGASQIILNSEYAGLTLMYRAVHGEEDRKHTPNPIDEKQFIEDFKAERDIK